MINQFRGEAFKILTTACRVVNMEGCLEMLLEAQDREAEKIVAKIRHTCVFNLTNFVLKCMIEGDITEQEKAEMFLNIAAELYEQWSSPTVDSWFCEWGCDISFLDFHDHYMNALEGYYHEEHEQFVSIVRDMTQSQSVRSVPCTMGTASQVKLLERVGCII